MSGGLLKMGVIKAAALVFMLFNSQAIRFCEHGILSMASLAGKAGGYAFRKTQRG